jgi:hypothetical protein
MRTNALKTSIIGKISQIQDESILKEISNLLEVHKAEIQITLSPEQKAEIAQAKIEVKNGDFLTESQFEKRFSKWKEEK